MADVRLSALRCFAQSHKVKNAKLDFERLNKLPDLS